ncbi:MAG: hypothetical protein ACM3IJ_02475 [Candidatus Levyibacteriota bacterium]
MQKSSRLARTSEQKSRKQIIIFSIATILFLAILFKFGPSVLSSVSSFPLFKKQAVNTAPVNDTSTLEAPFITSIPDATDSASIVISGTSSYSDAQVELYLNGKSYDTTSLSKDQRFSFDSIKLANGTNTIKARVKKGEETSDFTRDYTVIYSQGAPKLDVSSPSDGQQFTRGDQSINVQGSTDPDNDVTVNNFRAIVDSSGNFSYYMKLNEGDNQIKIIATNQAGKTTEKDLKVNYKP